jgi:hypothetical protein
MNDSEHFKKDFGAFYPAGYMVVGFRVQMDAKRVLQTLAKQGHQPDGFIELTSQQMVDFVEPNMPGAGMVQNLDNGLARLQDFLDAAKEDVYFLVLPTPDDAAAARATEAIRRVPYMLTERYHPMVLSTVHENYLNSAWYE